MTLSLNQKCPKSHYHQRVSAVREGGDTGGCVCVSVCVCVCVSVCLCVCWDEAGASGEIPLIEFFHSFTVLLFLNLALCCCIVQ